MKDSERTYSGIAGTGSYVPDRVVPNSEICEMLRKMFPDDPEKWTSNEWIVQRTGIEERRWAGPEENNWTMGAIALGRALVDAKKSPSDLELIICGTNTSAYNFPSAAGQIQRAVGAKCGFFDVQAGCTAFSYALASADAFIKTGQYKCIGVIGTDKLTDVTNFADRSTCVLFGDMASAMILLPQEEEGIINHYLAGIGDAPDEEGLYAIGMNADRKLYMKGREVFRFATESLPEAILGVLEGTGYTLDDVKLIVPHNANLRIIETAAGRLAQKAKIDPERMRQMMYHTISQYGNSSTASYPNAFHKARKEGRIKKGDLVVLAGFGAGLTYAANLLRL